MQAFFDTFTLTMHYPILTEEVIADQTNDGHGGDATHDMQENVPTTLEGSSSMDSDL